MYSKDSPFSYYYKVYNCCKILQALPMIITILIPTVTSLILPVPRTSDMIGMIGETDQLRQLRLSSAAVVDQANKHTRRQAHKDTDSQWQ